MLQDSLEHGVKQPVEGPQQHREEAKELKPGPILTELCKAPGGTGHHVMSTEQCGKIWEVHHILLDPG